MRKNKRADNTLRYRIEVFDRFPNYIRGVVVAEGICNYETPTGLQDLLDKTQQELPQRVSLEGLKEHPKIAPWRDAYKAFGVNPNKFPPSVEALVRQVLKGRAIRSINPVVDIFNYLSLKYLVPCGADDLQKVVGDLRLCYARGDEPFVPFDRQGEVENPKPGEVIYADSEKVLCRCWNWRQGYPTMLTPETKRVAINVDCLGISEGEAKAIAEEMARLVEDFCGGKVRLFFLSSRSPEIEF